MFIRNMKIYKRIALYFYVLKHKWKLSDMLSKNSHYNYMSCHSVKNHSKHFGTEGVQK